MQMLFLNYLFNNFICRGTFRMEREDGYAFDCRIPPFSLESKAEEPSTPNVEI